MFNDDDLYVVIVEDNCENEIEWNVDSLDIKQEPLDENADEVEYLLNTAAENGEILHMKQETEETNDEGEIHPKSENDSICSMKLKEEDDEEYLPQFIGENDYDEETSSNSENKWTDERRKKKHKIDKNHHKRTEIVSYVDEIRQQFPQFQNDEERLIDYIATKMKQIHRPAPPRNYFVPGGCTYKCSYCLTESSTEPAAERHYREKHGQRYLTCYSCGASFRSTTNLYKHEKQNCAAPDISIVLKARARLLGRKGKSRPFIPDLTNEPPKRFNCNECSATFSSKYSLEPHLRMHRGERPFLCPHCPRAYTSAVVLSHHLRAHSSVEYICDHCGRTFKEKGKLVVHMDTHAPLKKFPCDECPKRYATKSDLVIHVNRDHRKLPLPFACKICPRRFTRMSVFKIHMRKVHGMIIMTSNMFSKCLPSMTETQLQEAIVVLKNSSSFTSEENMKKESYSDEDS